MVSNSSIRSDPILFVIFGIPGAGKTTIANHVVQQLLTTNNSEGKRWESKQILDLDLDDCVPEWMRINFANGIYPTLQQRTEFSLTCCTYVNESIQKFTSNISTTTSERGGQIVVIVSFSFVNDDLRSNFRRQFPNSHWILINTSDSEAQGRIQQRSNHFYKGKPSNQPSTENNVTPDSCSTIRPKNTGTCCNDYCPDNNEWNFAPVTFPHTIVDGHNSIGVTSGEIVELIQNCIV